MITCSQSTHTHPTKFQLHKFLRKVWRKGTRSRPDYRPRRQFEHSGYVGSNQFLAAIYSRASKVKIIFVTRVTRIENVRDILDGLLQDHLDSHLAKELRSLLSRVIHMHLTWTSNFAVTRSCTELAVFGTPSTQPPSGHGRPKVHLNIDQVELLGQLDILGTKWQLH